MHGMKRIVDFANANADAVIKLCAVSLAENDNSTKPGEPCIGKVTGNKRCSEVGNVEAYLDKTAISLTPQGEPPPQQSLDPEK